MATVTGSCPGADRAPPRRSSSRPCWPRSASHHPKTSTGVIAQAYELAAAAHEGQIPQVRRALHPPPAVGGPDRGRPRPRRRHRGRRPAARRGRGHRRHARRRRRRVRRRGGRHRRRRHQARPRPVRLQGGPAGRHHAQDAGGDGQGPPGPDHQAGRPAAQHAHARRHARRGSRSAPPRRPSTSTRRWPTASACRT